MKHCPELENSSELGEDSVRWCMCVLEGLEERLEVEEMMMDRHRGSPPSIKAAGM